MNFLILCLLILPPERPSPPPQSWAGIKRSHTGGQAAEVEGCGTSCGFLFHSCSQGCHFFQMGRTSEIITGSWSPRKAADSALFDSAAGGGHVWALLGFLEGIRTRKRSGHTHRGKTSASGRQLFRHLPTALPSPGHRLLTLSQDYQPRAQESKRTEPWPPKTRR